MCCKKNLLIYILKKKLYSTYSSFLVINVCNQGKTLCSPCILERYRTMNSLQCVLEYSAKKIFFIVVPCILISIKFIHQQMQYLLNLTKF